MGFASQAINCRADQKLYHLQVCSDLGFCYRLLLLYLVQVQNIPSQCLFSFEELKLIELLLLMNTLLRYDI